MRRLSFRRCDRCGLSLKIIVEMDTNKQSTAVCRCGHQVDCDGAVIGVFVRRHEQFLVDAWTETPSSGSTLPPAR